VRFSLDNDATAKGGVVMVGVCGKQLMLIHSFQIGTCALGAGALSYISKKHLHAECLIL